MPCIDLPSNCPNPQPSSLGGPRGRLWVSLGAVAVLVGCKSTPLPPPSPPPAPVAPAARAQTPAPKPAGTSGVTPRSVPPAAPNILAAPTAVLGTWQAYRQRAAERVMLANPSHSFGGRLPDPLASIPVLQVRLNADGSVREIDVLRTPKFYPETVENAKRAVMRAAPFGPVGNLPQPWQFNETFLFNDEFKFQLDTLVANR